MCSRFCARFDRLWLVPAGLVLLLLGPGVSVYGTGLRETVEEPSREVRPPETVIVLPHDVVRVAVIAGTRRDDPLRRGAEQAARDISRVAAGGAQVVVISDGVVSEPAADLQINALEAARARGVHIVIIDPYDTGALDPYLAQAGAAGTTVVTVNRSTTGRGVATHVGTDHFRATATMLGHMVSYVGAVGPVGIVPGDPDHPANRLRRDALVRAIREDYPGVRLVDPDPEGVRDEAAAMAVTLEILAASPETRVLFGTDAESTLGVARGVSRAGLSGRVLVIGFDPGAQVLEMVQRGQIQGLIQEDPFTIGYVAMRRAIDGLRGIPLPEMVAVPYRFVGPDQR